MELYSAGPCSVCGPSGDLLLLRCIKEGRLFSWCPACGLAFGLTHDADGTDEFQAPEHFAPEGFDTASEVEVKRAGLEAVRVESGLWDDGVLELLEGLQCSGYQEVVGLLASNRLEAAAERLGELQEKPWRGRLLAMARSRVPNPFFTTG